METHEKWVQRRPHSDLQPRIVRTDRARAREVAACASTAAVLHMGDDLVPTTCTFYSILILVLLFVIPVFLHDVVLVFTVSDPPIPAYLCNHESETSGLTY